MNVLKRKEYPTHFKDMTRVRVCVCIHMCIQCMQIQILYQVCEETLCRFRSQEQDSREDSYGHGIAHPIP